MGTFGFSNSGAISAATVQLLSVTGSVSSWSSTVVSNSVTATTITLPSSTADKLGQTVTVRNTGAGTVTVAAFSGDVLTGQNVITTGNAVTYTVTALGTISTTSSIDAALQREGGVVLLNNQVFSTNLYVASTNGVYAIPSAGTWRLRYFISTDGTGANANNQFRIVNSIGTLVAGSERTRGGGSTTSEGLSVEALEVTTTGATTFTLMGRNGGSGSVTILATANSSSTIAWEKVSGYLPVTNPEVIASAVAPSATPNSGEKVWLNTALSQVTHVINAAGTAWVAVATKGAFAAYNITGSWNGLTGATVLTFTNKANARYLVTYSASCYSLVVGQTHYIRLDSNGAQIASVNHQFNLTSEHRQLSGSYVWTTGAAISNVMSIKTSATSDVNDYCTITVVEI